MTLKHLTVGPGCCGTCRFWKPITDGSSMPSADSDEMAREFAEGGAAGQCTLIAYAGGRVSGRGALAYGVTMFASGLLTRATFGCVMWRGRTGDDARP